MLDAFVRHDALPEHVVLTSSRAVYGEGPWRAADGTRLRAGAALARPARGRAVGPRRRRRRPADAARGRSAATTHPNPSQRLRLDEARPGAGAPQLVGRASRSRCRSSGSRTSTAPASRRTTPTPASSRSSTGSPRAARPSTSTRTARSTATSSTSTTSSPRWWRASPGRRRDQRILDVGNGVRTTILDAARMIAAHHGAPEPQISGQVPRRRRALGLGRRHRHPRGARLDADLDLPGRQRGGLRLAEAWRVPWLSTQVESTGPRGHRSPPSPGSSADVDPWLPAIARLLEAPRPASGSWWRSAADPVARPAPGRRPARGRRGAARSPTRSARCPRPCAGPVLLMTAPVLVPADGPRHRARRAGRRRPGRLGLVPEQRRRAPQLPAPTNRPTQYSLEGHDETTLTRLLRSSEPRLDAGPDRRPGRRRDAGQPRLPGHDQGS